MLEKQENGDLVSGKWHVVTQGSTAVRVSQWRDVTGGFVLYRSTCAVPIPRPLKRRVRTGGGTRHNPHTFPCLLFQGQGPGDLETQSPEV